MGVDFVWEVHDEEAEPVVPPPARPVPPPPILTLHDDGSKRGVRRLRRVHLLVSCLVLTLLTGTWRYVADTASRNLRLAERDLLAVAQTEVAALVRDDEDLYRSLQATNAFVSTQFAWEQEWLAGASPADALGRQILGLSWHGDRADVWLGYVADGVTYARWQGYQHTEGRWLRTEVSEGRWGEARTLATAHFLFRYHAAEAAVVAALAQWAEVLHASLNIARRETSGPVVVELQPYLAQSLAWSGQHRVMLTSPLLVGVALVPLRNAPPPEAFAGLAYTPAEGQSLLAEMLPLDPQVAAAFTYAVALALANDAAGDVLYSGSVHWLMAEAAARYEVERLVPELALANDDRVLLRAVVAQGAVLPLSALWTGAVVVAAEDDCGELPPLAEHGTACYPRTGERVRAALAQAKSLIAFAQEQAMLELPDTAVVSVAIAGRFVEAVSADEAAAIRYLLPDDVAASPNGMAFWRSPEQFVAAWHIWLKEHYG